MHKIKKIRPQLLLRALPKIIYNLTTKSKD